MRAGRRWAAIADRDPDGERARNRQSSLQFPPYERDSPNRQRGGREPGRRDGLRVRRPPPKAALDPISAYPTSGLRFAYSYLFWSRSFISRPPGSTAPASVSATSIPLPKTCRAPSRSPGSEAPPPAAEGNPDPLPGEREPRPASVPSVERKTTALQDSAMGRAAFLQSPRPMPSHRAIFGSRGAASGRGYARPGRSSREGFCEICLTASVGRARETLPGCFLPHHARVRQRRAHNGEADCEIAQRAP